MTTSSDKHDAIVIGASLAGCTTAVLLARAGASVLLIDKQPEMSAYKVVCGHYIQSSAIPTIERLGLLEPMMAAGALRSPPRFISDEVVVGPVEPEVVEPPINLPRKKLDPMLRELASGTPGIELRMGAALESIESLRPGECRIQLKNANGSRERVAARLLVAADGRDSTFAKLSKARTLRTKNGRFNYSPFYTGPAPDAWPATSTYFMGEQWAGAFPTADGLTGYYLMPTRDRLEEFKADLEGACLRMISELPAAPPVEQLTLAGPIVGRLDMSNQWRNPVRRGAALVGDAAFSIDPLAGIGCGWAFQSGAMLADEVAPALVAGESLSAPLRSFRRKVSALIVPHTLQIIGYSRGRELNSFERFVMRRAARSAGVEKEFIALVTRNVSPFRLMGPRATVTLLRG
ncbi:MAG: FAD-dependent monooxygenase [Thermoleophilaceae bacterium]|nr:FAD-dependent monooxygenase [Thermoleophilaceae bacterium]